MSTELHLLPRERPNRVIGDRLELLSTLLNGPGIDPLFRQDVIEFPPDDRAYGWRCSIAQCTRPRAWLDGTRMCGAHYQQWLKARTAGTTRGEFNETAVPLQGARSLLGECRICRHRPVLSRSTDLCRRHQHNWRHHRDQLNWTFDAWLAGQRPYLSYGRCVVAVCANYAESPLGLCPPHRENYHKDCRPGGAKLPFNWLRTFELKALPTPVEIEDPAVFRNWCWTARTARHCGELSLLGLRPLLKAELQWGLHAHSQRTDAAYWPMGWLRAFGHYCRVRDINRLEDIDLADCSHTDRMIAGEIQTELRRIYFSPTDSREAGFIDTEHFGRKMSETASYFDLTTIEVRWLRDLLWDHLADRLTSAQCPRSRKPFDGLRHAVRALSAFLVLDAPGRGQDPRLLGAQHMQRFVADVRHREHERLPQLGWAPDGRPVSVMTEHSRRDIFNHGRRLLVDALESGKITELGLDPRFVAALPNGGDNKKISRNPFTDDTARALADEANLERLGSKEFDPLDTGFRDIWETILTTGRRCSEVLNVRLDCIGRYNGLPMLWHDQTKVGNYNAGIRIPERIHDRLDERRRRTLIRFEHRTGRQPTADERAHMALFPSHVRNHDGHRSITYTTFHRLFRDWVETLQLGACVPHQARHTLATKLLKHGATLTHIRQYLGQVSERMAEHYTKVAGSELDDILQVVWVAGPGTPHPGTLLSTDVTAPLDKHKALAMAVDLSRTSTPAEGGFCTFQPVVDGGACPRKLDCENCDRFVLSGADLLYWRRKQEQWRSIAERAPDDATADYLHKVFEPTARAIEGLEKALAGLGLLDQALALDMRRPQDYFHRVWNVGFLAHDLGSVAEDTTHDQETG